MPFSYSGLLTFYLVLLNIFPISGAAIIEAKKVAQQAGRHLEVIGYILGTDLDRQNLAVQLKKLESTGATYASSMQNAALLAREFVEKGDVK